MDSGGTRYGESRTLARGLCRLPGQTREEFKQNVRELRRHLERFNLDASELCQWLMGLRPGGKHGGESTQAFWEFFLNPAKSLNDEDKGKTDEVRRAAFDVVAGWSAKDCLDEYSLEPPLPESVRAVKKLPLTPTAKNLFERIRNYEDGHRALLLKAVAEWVDARYWSGVQKQKPRYDAWHKEKDEWEKKHPELTEEARDKFTEIFRQMGVRDKRARVCSWERLKGSRDNCEYAGERVGKKNHAPLCAKYKKFFNEYSKKPHVGKNFKSHFVENAKKYLKDKKTGRQPSMKESLRQKWFPGAWEEYRKAIGVDEKTILNKHNGCLPHCVEFGDDVDCEHNKHTDLCRQYKSGLDNRPELQEVEGLYREWRGLYLSGPKKPSFRYPSSKALPMPKIFGKGFYRADFDRSVLELRLEGMPKGEFLSFGFKPWPEDYSPQPGETEITSVHINFIGTRGRAGFRFSTPHKQSRFGISQDELDELRSRVYPRQAQDGEFLKEARQRLLSSFTGAEGDLKMMAVDLGTGGGGAVLFKGREYIETVPLKVVKIDELFERRPDKINGKEVPVGSGLNVEHAGRHLEKWAEKASKVAQKRSENKNKAGASGLGSHDLRRLSLHMRRMYKDWVRLNAKQIIETADNNSVDLIVFESMRGFSVPGRDKLGEKFEKEKRRKAFWSHGRIRHKVKEKAVERGMRVIGVPYFKSSQICAECRAPQENHGLWTKNKTKKLFKCEKCRHESNSDENAARLLGRVFWGEIELPVAPPA